MKDLKSIQTILKQLKPELQRNYHVQSIGIFGSAARNDLNDTSDIDLIVDFNGPVGVAFIDLANFLELKMNTKVDLVSRKGIKPHYLKAIEKDIIYV